MGKIWFSSDLHLGHNREFLYVPRGFTSIEEHDETIIKNWNSVISPEDEVYILGDLMLNDNEHGFECIQKLNGWKHIILGNHDTDNRMHYYWQLDKILCNQFADRLIYKSEPTKRKYTFYLSHYPTMTSNMDNGAPISQHVINLSGHTHSRSKFYNEMPFIYNVALDAHNNYPVEIEEVIADIKEKVRSLYQSDESLYI